MIASCVRHLLAAVLVAVALSCSSGEREMADSARRLGREHAQLLIDCERDTLRMQYLLLEVRSREQLLRSNDYQQAADTYIRAFEEYIRDNNDSLARLIF